jgi:signal transduction histidine kinase/ActR/RegA family two-component response regulator
MPGGARPTRTARPDAARWIARATGVAAAATGLAVLYGWASGDHALTRLGPPITMKPNAAVCLVLLGAALWRRAAAVRPPKDRIAAALAGLAAAIGAVTLLEHLARVDLGIDQLLFAEPAGQPATASPGRMGPPASTSFFLLGASLALLGSPRRPVRTLVEGMLLATSVIALLSLVGYGYQTAELYGVARLTGIALVTAVAIEALALGSLLVTGEGGLVATMRGGSAAARLARRTLAYSTVVPLAIGWVIARGLQGGLYDGAFAVAVLVLSLITSVTLLAWREALRVGRSEEERERALAEVKAAEAALREAVDKLREADRRKDEFLGMLSHELRNPLAPIRNALYVLQRAEPGAPQAQRAREIANRQVTHLARLVDDLLDVTRIARGKIELRREALDLAALARRTAEDHRALMADRGLALSVDVAPGSLLVSGDATRLTQVLGNLLSNAAKFTPAGGRVTLAVRAERGAAAVEVQDTGIGIDPALLAAVFDPFTQAEQTLARSEGGLGLGLALVKGLVELHGGEVAAESGGPGRGACFRVLLPLLAERGRAAGGTGAAGAREGTARRRVLVVDDNRDAAESLAQLVELFGHDAVVAYDGPSAVERVRARQPDVVLCDLGLPGMDGYEVAPALRAAGAGAARLIAVSGYARPEDVRRARDAGFDGHIAKPPDPDEIERLLAAPHAAASAAAPPSPTSGS